ncbi:hypothetical protein [Flavobacterium sp.]|uniref:hypothetical protein n=1 Tax=Flavobacterium sp. TaxID=239 RepID=UPI003C369760
MKKTVILFIVTMFLNITFVSAKELNPKKSYAKASQEITTLLTPFSEVGELENDVVVKVRVLVTPSREIIVLQANTDNEELADYIKETLNYKKLSSDELVTNNTYVFEVRFKA